MASSRMVADSSIFIEFLRAPDKKRTTLYQLFILTKNTKHFERIDGLTLTRIKK